MMFDKQNSQISELQHELAKMKKEKEKETGKQHGVPTSSNDPETGHSPSHLSPLNSSNPMESSHTAHTEVNKQANGFSHPSPSSVSTDTTVDASSIDSVFTLDKYVGNSADLEIDTCLAEDELFGVSVIPFDLASVSGLVALPDDMVEYLSQLVRGFEFPEVHETGTAEELPARIFYEFWRRNKPLVSRMVLKDSATMLPLLRDKIVLRSSNIATIIRLMNLLTQTIALSSSPSVDAEIAFNVDFVRNIHSILDWSLGFKARSPVSSLCVKHMAQALLLIKDLFADPLRCIEATDCGARYRSIASLFVYKKQSPIIKRAHALLHDTQERLEALEERTSNPT